MPKISAKFESKLASFELIKLSSKLETIHHSWRDARNFKGEIFPTSNVPIFSIIPKFVFSFLMFDAIIMFLVGIVIIIAGSDKKVVQ